MAAILPYAKMTRRLSPEEFFEFCNSIIRRSQADVVLVARLALRYASFHGAFTVYDKGFKRPLKAPETKKIKELDTKRKGFFSLIDDDVRKLAKIAVDPAVLEAADFIIPLLDNYACTPKIEYEGETGAIIDMMQEFDKAENVARLALLGQTANVASLKQVNIEFQALYETRFENRYAFKQGGTTLQRRRVLTSELTNFFEAVNGLLLTATDPDEIDGLRAIVATINSTIEQYNIIVNKHLGIIAAKKKNNDKENGKNDSETQTPDTTNPPAPDTPPQTPDVTPPPIDPDELNPPAVGER